MTDRENFLERWSRRKIEAERQEPDDDRAGAAARATEQESDSETSEPAAEMQSPAQSDAAPPDAEPAFDITTLPSLDSITAASDVRAFLTPGVPAELTRAALRRAWAADPTIRDFKGLAENDWDFTDPKAMAGFSELPADYDIEKVITKIFGEKEKAADAASAVEPERTVASLQRPDRPEEISAAQEAQPLAFEGAVAAESAQPELASPAEGDLVRRNNNTATHNSNSADRKEEAKTRRSHGTALPQ
jgi:hypothetical protein